MTVKELTEGSVQLLKDLIAIQSFSREEDRTGDAIQNFFEEHGVPVQRVQNNIIVKNKHFEPGKPAILLNSHHDTVKPNKGYTRDPFLAHVEEGKLFGLGSNDAGGPLVSLMATFLHFYYKTDLAYNIYLVASAEEEVSGKEGIEIALPVLENVEVGVVGEPTGMNMAVAEKGLMVLDCEAKGVAGHAARDIGENAIYKAIKDIDWIRAQKLSKTSQWLGPVKMSVTVINAGSQHNVIPDSCKFVVDVRVNDCYTLPEIVDFIKKGVSSEVVPRSMRMNPSTIPVEHPLVLAAKNQNIHLFGSDTTSDQALMPFSTVKMGPGLSERSHTADEFIYLSEIEEGIKIYIRLLEEVLTKPTPA
ncbi:MAG: M20 family metallo-hydrolase [Imperialibacter sp.]|uniref:M20 family metallo-hydrolase n=1 Tax=Imperialibacter sp. TaxID=2038411 RepID=UPI003A8C534D